MIQKPGSLPFIAETYKKYEKELQYSSLVKNSLGARLARFIRELFRKIGASCCHADYDKKIQGRIKDLRNVLNDASYERSIRDLKIDHLPDSWKKDFSNWKEELISLRTKLQNHAKEVEFKGKHAFEHCNAFVKKVRYYIDLQKKYFGTEEKLQAAFINHVVGESQRTIEVVKQLKGKLASNLLYDKVAIETAFSKPLEDLTAFGKTYSRKFSPQEQPEKIKAALTQLEVIKAEIGYAEKELVLETETKLNETERWMTLYGEGFTGTSDQLAKHSENVRNLYQAYYNKIGELSFWIATDGKMAKEKLQKRLEAFKTKWEPLMKKLESRALGAEERFSSQDIESQKHLADQAFVERTVAEGRFQLKNVEADGHCLFRAVIAGLQPIEGVKDEIKKMTPQKFREAVYTNMKKQETPEDKRKYQEYRERIPLQLIAGFSDLQELNKNGEKERLEVRYLTWPPAIIQAFKEAINGGTEPNFESLIDPYLAEMATEAAYGDEVEINAIMDFLQMPMRIYSAARTEGYYDPCNNANYKNKPIELFLIRPDNRAHYDALIKKPLPPPQENKPIKSPQENKPIK